MTQDVAETLHPSNKSLRHYSNGTWCLTELMVLQAAKREEYEHNIGFGAREKHKKKDERWSDVEDYCWNNSVHRSAKACLSRWDTLIADFRKINDYEKDNTNGHHSYWQMTSAERKQHILPLNFIPEVYDAIDSWYGWKASTHSESLAMSQGAPETMPQSKPAEDTAEKMSSSKQVSIEIISKSEKVQPSCKPASIEATLPCPKPATIEITSKPATIESISPFSCPMGKGNTETMLPPKSGRHYSTGPWSLAELLILQAAKREEYEMNTGVGARKKNKKKAERWSDIEDFCWKNVVHRSAKACQSRWDTLIADFKKISDHGKDIFSSRKSYWQMTPGERKQHNFPLNFISEIYDALDSWYGQKTSGSLGSESSLPDSHSFPNKGKDLIDIEDEVTQTPSKDGSSVPRHKLSRKRHRIPLPHSAKGWLSILQKVEHRKRQRWQMQDEKQHRLTMEMHKETMEERRRATEVNASIANALNLLATSVFHFTNYLMTQREGAAMAAACRDGSANTSDARQKDDVL